MKNTMCFMDMSVCQRTVLAALDLPLSSRPARPTAAVIIPHDLIMPMTPAMAIPPMPIIRAYSLKITSGGRAVMASLPYVPSRGTIIHHTNIEPANMTNAYLSPTM